jgi:PIN domain nuclease of toxin-antitoxin system
MHLLLDTHILIWWFSADQRLSKKAISLITDAEEVYVSSASIWEATIKKRLGKLDADLSLITTSLEKEGFIELPVRIIHILQTLELPEIHRDPFDRILIAQAISEPLRFVTSDCTLKGYSDLIELV